MTYTMYKINIFATGALLAFAWSWLPWSIYNYVVLVTDTLPTAGLLGYYFITIMCAGTFAAIVEHFNPRTEIT